MAYAIEVGKAIDVAWGKLTAAQKRAWGNQESTASAHPSPRPKPKPKPKPKPRKVQTYGGMRVAEGATVRLRTSYARKDWQANQVSSR